MDPDPDPDPDPDTINPDLHHWKKVDYLIIVNLLQPPANTLEVLQTEINDDLWGQQLLCILAENLIQLPIYPA